MNSRRSFICSAGAVAALAAPAILIAPARSWATGRIMLDDQGLDLWCSPTGDDANDGLSPSTPLRSTNAAWRKLVRGYDLCGARVQINHAPGSYPAISLKGPLVGQTLRPRIIGSTTRGECVISGVSKALEAESAEVMFEGFQISASDSGISSQFGARVFYRDIDFAQCGHHIQTQKAGETYFVARREDQSKSNYFISGDAVDHLYVNGGGIAYLTDSIDSNGIQFLGQRIFNAAFANIIQGGTLTAHTNAWSGPVPLRPFNPAIGLFEPCPALLVRWNSVGGNKADLPGDQASCFCDSSSFMA